MLDDVGVRKSREDRTLALSRWRIMQRHDAVHATSPSQGDVDIADARNSRANSAKQSRFDHNRADEHVLWHPARRDGVKNEIPSMGNGPHTGEGTGPVILIEAVKLGNQA